MTTFDWIQAALDLALLFGAFCLIHVQVLLQRQIEDLKHRERDDFATSQERMNAIAPVVRGLEHRVLSIELREKREAAR